MPIKSYDECPIWSEIPKLLPENNRIGDGTKPEEICWEWEGNAIHIDYYRNPNSSVKVILLHGVGGNGRLLSFVGVPLYKRGFEVLAPDLPGYGLTVMNSGSMDYQDWVRIVNDLIDYELSKDKRPVVLFGLSAGGMLAYHAACVNKKVSGIIATNVLDQRIQKVRDASAINKFASRAGLPVLNFFSHINDKFKIPMRAIANMKAIVNDERLVKLLLKDKTSSGVHVSIRFVLSLLNSKPSIEPEEFDICPFLLVHPEKDKWTPVDLSLLFFDKLKCKKRLVMLENAGHFPMEKPGIEQLEETAAQFLNSVSDNCVNYCK